MKFVHTWRFLRFRWPCKEMGDVEKFVQVSIQHGTDFANPEYYEKW